MIIQWSVILSVDQPLNARTMLQVRFILIIICIIQKKIVNSSNHF